MNGINALIKEALERYLAPSSMWGHNDKTAICVPRNCWEAQCLLLFFLRTARSGLGKLT